MGPGNFGGHNNNITIYVTRLYNEAKYLEPPIPFRSFVRHISKHLPREVQITLMTREIAEINELEKKLDIFQRIRDREIGRHPNLPVAFTNGNNNQARGYPVSYTHLDVYKRQG